jgi:hypothetical protein
MNTASGRILLALHLKAANRTERENFAMAMRCSFSDALSDYDAGPTLPKADWVQFRTLNNLG